MVIESRCSVFFKYATSWASWYVPKKIGNVKRLASQTNQFFKSADGNAKKYGE
jgi:hypothetical protein